MKVRTAFQFTDDQRRTIRAAFGRGGKATRKECLVFIDRAVHAALDAAPTPKPSRRTPLAQTTDAEFAARVEEKHAERYPHGCPMLCEACARRLGIANETEAQRVRRNNIARHYGHQTTAAVAR